MLSFSITFGISIGLCAMALIVERNEGLFDRTWVAGVNAAEIVIAQVFSQFFILAVQITLLLLVTIFAFKVKISLLYIYYCNVSILVYRFTLLLWQTFG